MKKLLIPLLVVLALSTPTLGAEKKSVVSIDLLDFTRDVASFRYERAYSPHWSFHVSPRLLIGDASGLGVLGGMRWYIDLAPRGLFFDMVGGLASVSSGGVTGTGYWFGGGAGYKFFASESFTIEGCLGVSYITATASVGFFSVSASGFATTSSLSLGYAF